MEKSASLTFGRMKAICGHSRFYLSWRLNPERNKTGYLPVIKDMDNNNEIMEFAGNQPASESELSALFNEEKFGLYWGSRQVALFKDGTIVRN